MTWTSISFGNSRSAKLDAFCSSKFDPAQILEARVVFRLSSVGGWDRYSLRCDSLRAGEHSSRGRGKLRSDAFSFFSSFSLQTKRGLHRNIQLDPALNLLFMPREYAVSFSANDATRCLSSPFSSFFFFSRVHSRNRCSSSA